MKKKNFDNIEKNFAQVDSFINIPSEQIKEKPADPNLNIAQKTEVKSVHLHLLVTPTFRNKIREYAKARNYKSINDFAINVLQSYMDNNK
nr:MAG: Ribbon-helix-helix protein, copG family protein [Bacteriophage sp.]